MTLFSKNEMVEMKSKNGIVSEPAYVKPKNLKMAIDRNPKKVTEGGGMDSYGVGGSAAARGTVLVNNVNSIHRNPGTIANVRTIIAGSKSIGVTGSELMRCKRKIHFISGQTYPGSGQPASVARRNARERNRVKQVNNGFATLRSHIPASVAAALTSDKSSPRNSSASKKLSKVETLKMAVEYIRSLQQMLEDHNSGLEKKVALDHHHHHQVGYEKRFEMDENYYSSSPETVSSGLGDSTRTYVDSDVSPCRVFPKIEPADTIDSYSRRQYSKTETSDEAYAKTEMHHGNSIGQKFQDALESDFYGARSPVKTYYLGPEDGGVHCEYETGNESYDQTGTVSVVSDELDYAIQSECSPVKRDRSPSLTVLTSVSPANHVVHLGGRSFVQTRTNADSLSPTISEACPSPAPSCSSDRSSVHLNGSRFVSRLTANRVVLADPHPDSFPTRLPSPMARRPSPKCPTPPLPLPLPPTRNASPLPGPAEYLVPDSSSPSSNSGYSVCVEYRKGSPEGYDNYDSVSPEDEELLDVISWWQQSH